MEQMARDDEQIPRSEFLALPMMACLSNAYMDPVSKESKTATIDTYENPILLSNPSNLQSFQSNPSNLDMY
ncbi:hypothetical protein B9Z55_000596 [Caenorhabditis nigoni]|uniref:Uncharacterized protein n=1 Tax=Caenorhabditis nigoni TaxID=1611254 RepID=A0A2G5VUL1_9PELO|nr:hypothetical protein B9Z55_000596 [Caenorhabditis nigoni]